jgi:hypothetical protein
MATTIPHKFYIVRFQRHFICGPHMKWSWNRTILNLCGIVAAILKMVTGRNFTMSGHHYLPTYQILMISDNVEFLRYCGGAKTRYKKWGVKIQHCPISSKFYMWVDNDVPNWFRRNFNFPIGFYNNPHPLWTPQNKTLTPFTTKLLFVSSSSISPKFLSFYSIIKL